MQLEGKDEEYIAGKEARSNAVFRRAEIDELQSELTAARDEAERLRARVAELELERKVFSAPVEVDRSWAEAAILRKQAEALETEASTWNSDADGGIVVAELRASANILRQQAQSIEKGE